MLKMGKFFMMRDLYSQGMCVSEISSHTGIDALYDWAIEISDIG